MLRHTHTHTLCLEIGGLSYQSHSLTHTCTCTHTLRAVQTGAGTWKGRDSNKIHDIHTQKYMFTSQGTDIWKCQEKCKGATYIHNLGPTDADE